MFQASKQKKSSVKRLVYRTLRSIYRKLKPKLVRRIEIEYEAESSMHVGERHFEYPFAIKSIVNLGKDRIQSTLDVGCTGSVFPIILASMGFHVTGTDINKWQIRYDNFEMVVDDIKRSKFEDESFDLITAISTIEHCGLPRYGEEEVPNGDKLAVKEIYRILRKGGYFIITVPFGRSMIYRDEYRIYSMGTFMDLVEDFQVIEQEFYGPIHMDTIYEKCNEEDSYRIGTSKGIYCIMCALLKK